MKSSNEIWEDYFIFTVDHEKVYLLPNTSVNSFFNEGDIEAEKFVFRLPVYDTFFEKYGEVVDFAMICRNDGKSPVSITTLDGIRTPYLGLALD